MKFYKLFSFLFLVATTVVFSQEKINHTVVQGESVYSIAKKYNVKQAEILALNPKAKKTLRLNMVLVVPNKNYQPQEIQKRNATILHEVLAKETLYGISKKYNVSIDKIKEANPFIESEGLKLGVKLSIPGVDQSWVSTENTSKINPENQIVSKPAELIVETPKFTTNQVVSDENGITHIVQPKETKYRLAKQYGISIGELEKMNPDIVAGLPVGYNLIIKKGKQDINNPISETGIKNSAVNLTQPPGTDSNDVASTDNSEISVAPIQPLSLENMSKADFLITKALENLGVRYRSGATGNGGFDCSGLMFATFKNIEMTLPRSSQNMASSAGVKIDKSQAQKGDLIFFATMGKGRVSHVGMITEVLEDEIKFIHSSSSSGVIISSIKEPYYAKRFVQINRVLN